MADVSIISNDAIKTGASDFLGLCKYGIINSWLVYGNLNETARPHFGTCPPHEELINLRIYLIFICLSSQRAVALLCIITHHGGYLLGRRNVGDEVESRIGGMPKVEVILQRRSVVGGRNVTKVVVLDIHPCRAQRCTLILMLKELSVGITVSIVGVRDSIGLFGFLVDLILIFGSILLHYVARELSVIVLRVDPVDPAPRRLLSPLRVRPQPQPED